MALAGHIQRGGNPCSYDRFMATRFGVYGANLLLNKDFGKLVVFDKNEIKAIPLSETAGKLKFVDPECEVVSISIGSHFAKIRFMSSETLSIKDIVALYNF